MAASFPRSCGQPYATVVPATSSGDDSIRKRCGIKELERDEVDSNLEVCQRRSAEPSARADREAHYSGREMPSLCIAECSVERFIPRRAAAPLGPPTTQSESRRAPR